MNATADNSALPGWHTVTPRIVARDVPGLVAFIKQVFVACGDYEQERPTVLTIGDSRIMLSDVGARAAAPAFLYVYVADVDATFRRAQAAGAVVIEAPAQMPYGDRRAMVVDGWGNTWQIAAHHDT